MEKSLLSSRKLRAVHPMQDVAGQLPLVDRRMASGVEFGTRAVNLQMLSPVRCCTGRAQKLIDLANRLVPGLAIDHGGDGNVAAASQRVNLVPNDDPANDRVACP